MAEAVYSYTPQGSLLELFSARDPEIILEGPAGTGKTYGVCHLLHLLALKWPGVRILMLRKTLVSLTDTALVTFREKVLAPGDPVTWFGGSRVEPASFRYDNGARIIVGGMDNPSKFLSGEYDLIYCNECTEFNIEQWETLTSRLRNGVLPQPRLIGDTNPTYDRHPLYQREGVRWIKSTHSDNPTITPEYLETLQRMTGTRYQRFFLGQRVGLENAIYADALDESRMFIEIPERIGWGKGSGGMDFGRIHYSAVVALQQAHDGRWWVRECWTGHNDKDLILGAARKFHKIYGLTRGVTDPLQDWASQDLTGYGRWKIAKSGAGSRKGRIARVLSMLENDELRFDRSGEGVADLWAELWMYRYEVKETDTMIDDVVVRKDDDRVAALEYAVEALDTEPAPMPMSVSLGRPTERRQTQGRRTVV